MHTFLFAARARREELFVLYATALKTGLRLGELLGLTWHHVDLERRRITVERSYSGPAATCSNCRRSAAGGARRWCSVTPTWRRMRLKGIWASKS
jgi:integrase